MSLDSKNVGKIYIVSTPIGNLSDITLRALDILKSVDIIACEDTRHTLQLLTHYDIKKSLISYHEHNKYDKIQNIIEEVLNGKNVAYVSDAGTPIISDPGDILVEKAIENNIEITAIPGPCACINAMVLSGLSAKRFTFLGFLPDNEKEKKEILENVKNNIETIVIYSSKSQIKKDLVAIYEILGNNRRVAIAREMTKIHEEVIRGTIEDIYNNIENINILGEFVVCIEGINEEIIKNDNKAKWLEMTIEEHMKYYLDKGYDEKDSMKKVAKDRNVDKNDIYKKVKTKC